MLIEKQKPMPLFVYGTLRSDEWRWRCIIESIVENRLTEISRFEMKFEKFMDLVEKSTPEIEREIEILTVAVPGTLWAFRTGFPGAVFDPSANTLVHGEAITVPDTDFDAVYDHICRIEGYRGKDNRNNLFEKIIVEALDIEGNTHECLSFQPSLEFLKRLHDSIEPWHSKPMEIEDGRWFTEKHANFADETETAAEKKYLEDLLGK